MQRSARRPRDVVAGSPAADALVHSDNEELTFLVDTLLLVTAHPDDEVMFFSPLLEAACVAGWRMRVFCLTDGGSEGGDSGSVRRGELHAAAALFGFEAAVASLPGVRDGMREVWDIDAAASAIKTEMASSRIAAVFTFDSIGVTGHPNHVSTREVVLRALRGSVGRAGDVVPVFELVSEPFPRRFLGPFCGVRKRAAAKDGLPVRRGGAGMGAEAAMMMMNWPAGDEDDLIVRARGLFPCMRAHAGMMMHKSQYLWWRLLWVIFSTYTYALVLRPVTRVA